METADVRTRGRACTSWETAFHFTYFEDGGCSMQVLVLFFFLTSVDVLTSALPDI